MNDIMFRCDEEENIDLPELSVDSFIHWGIDEIVDKLQFILKNN